MSTNTVQDAVREKYGEIARTAGKTGCCGPTACGCEYNVEDARAFLAEGGLDVDALAPHVQGKFLSAFVRGRKPEAKSCCGPECGA